MVEEQARFHLYGIRTRGSLQPMRSRPSYGAQMCWIQGARPANWSKGAALAAFIRPGSLCLPGRRAQYAVNALVNRSGFVHICDAECAGLPRMDPSESQGLTDKRRAPQQQQDRKKIAGIRSRKQCGSGSQDSQEEDATRGYLSGDEAPQGL